MIKKMKKDDNKYIKYNTTIIKKNNDTNISNIIIDIKNDEILVSIKEGYHLTYKDLMVINNSILEKLDKQEKDKNKE